MSAVLNSEDPGIRHRISVWVSEAAADTVKQNRTRSIVRNFFISLPLNADMVYSSPVSFSGAVSACD